MTPIRPKSLTAFGHFLVVLCLSGCKEPQIDDTCQDMNSELGLVLDSVTGVAANRGSLAYYSQSGDIWASNNPEKPTAWSYFFAGGPEPPSNEYEGILSAAVDDSFIYIATGRKALLPKMLYRRKIINGTGWEKVDVGIPNDTVLSILSLSNGTLWAITANQGNYYSTDRARTWRLGGPIVGSLQTARLIQQDRAIIMCGRGSLFLPILFVSYDLGTHWTYIPIDGNDEGTLLSATVNEDDSLHLFSVVQDQESYKLYASRYSPIVSSLVLELRYAGDLATWSDGTTALLADSLYVLDYDTGSWRAKSIRHGTFLGRSSTDWSNGNVYTWEGRSGSFKTVRLCPP